MMDYTTKSRPVAYHEQLEQKIGEMEAQIKQYKESVNKMRQGDKLVGKVLSPAFVVGEMTYARVEVGGAERVCAIGNSMVFSYGEKALSIAEGDEVIVVEGNIVDLIPKELSKVKAMPTMNLIRWEDIGGYGDQKKRIRDSIETPLRNKDLAREFGVKTLKGAYLYGPPGTGKTLIAKAVASSIIGSHQIDARAFTYIKGPEILSHLISVAEKRVAQIFKDARDFMKESGQQAVIFIDEAEAILNQRGNRRSSDVDATVVPAFLAEMDGFDEGNPFVLLATNRPETLDEAVIRPGRIDLRILISRPTRSESEEIFRIHLDNYKTTSPIDTMVTEAANAIFSCHLKDFVSGALIATSVEMAAQRALNRFVGNPKSPRGIMTSDLVDAINSTKDEAGSTESPSKIILNA